MKTTASSLPVHTVAAKVTPQDRPEQRIGLVGPARQAVRGDGDDGDDDRANAVEDRLHPGHAAVRDVRDAERQHHQERREDEREPDQRCPQHAAVEIADRHRRLRRQGAGHDLRERDRQVVGGLVDHLAILDEVAPHVSDERRRAAETDATPA